MSKSRSNRNKKSVQVKEEHQSINIPLWFWWWLIPGIVLYILRPTGLIVMNKARFSGRSIQGSCLYCDKNVVYFTGIPDLCAKIKCYLKFKREFGSFK